MRKRLFALLALAPVLAVAPAHACSVIDTYRVPTNIELADKADLILIGHVEDGPAIDAIDNPNDMFLTVRPIAALKGDLPSGTIRIPGALAPERFQLLSNPYQLEEAHPLAYIGGCTRYMFVRGTDVLFFLQRGEKLDASLAGQWVSAGDPFTRWAEDVPSPDAPWPRAIRFYLTVLALPEAERSAALTAERDRLRALAATPPYDPVAQLLAADIDRQLAGPNKPWNAQMDGVEEDKVSKAEAAARAIDEMGDAAQAEQPEEIDDSPDPQF